MRTMIYSLVLATGAGVIACDDSNDDGENTSVACDAEPVIRTTSEGVDFVRTPDSCFASLPGWPYEARYVTLDGLRQAYVDEGPVDGPVVLLLHGQPSWSYLYRKMIPVLVDGGYRVIAMDHLGMGRSDKPIAITDYSYLGHSDRLLRFIEALELRDIHLFVQDWGSLIGLRIAGLNPDRFARIAVGDGALPVIPAGAPPFPPVEDPDEILDLPDTFAQIPEQQVPFYDGCELLADQADGSFGDWMIFAMKSSTFRASSVIEGLTWFDLPTDEEAAYDAPFPSRIYMAGARVFPSLTTELPGLNADAWAGLTSFERPFLTLWATNDAGNLGRCETQMDLVNAIPGAKGMPHDRLEESSHFLQDDQGQEIARRLVSFFRADPANFGDPLGRGDRYCELLIVRQQEMSLAAEIWGTQGLNDCPAASWDALDLDAIQAETGAVNVVRNGPRFWLPNTTNSILSSGQVQTFGDLRMSLVGAVEIGSNQSSSPYTETRVQRTTTFIFDSGEEIYELTSPDGVVYVMQSVTQSVDPSLTLTDLPSLGARLTLPDGWSFAPRTLTSDLLLTVENEAAILQDDLQNTYQRATASTSSSTPTLPVLANGTGTPCTSDMECAGLEASLCLGDGTGGFCTVEGCTGGSCGAPYVCCSDCNPAAAAQLPFEDSACIPEVGAAMFSSQAGCTCE